MILRILRPGTKKEQAAGRSVNRIGGMTVAHSAGLMYHDP